MTAQTTFQRNEKKFLLPQWKVQDLLAGLSGKMQQDEYGLHTICSLYYDTPDFYCAHRQAEKPIYKEKLRLRSYGVPQNDTVVFLELKKKLCGITYKRRISLPLQAAKAYLQHGIRPQQTGQVFGEIDWFLSQKQLEPKAVVCYDRIALFGREDAALRVTLDSNVRWRSEGLDLAKGDWGSPLLAKGTVLVEVKTPGSIPFWLCGVLSAQQLYSGSFSKYGNTYTNIVCEEVQRRAG